MKLSAQTKKIGLSIALAGLITLILIIAHLEANLPSVEILKEVQLQVPLKIYTIDGKLIAEYGEKRRTPLKLEQIPQQLINAVIATEDRRFYKHPGVDVRGMLRAVANLVTKGTKEQGGSTITMQVARNFFLTRNKTFTRKLNEILLALKIEKELTKEEILELYLNKIYFGKRAYGVAAAAEVYYGTTVENLTLAQMAMLAGLPQAPSAINPLNSPENALKRRAHVLERMKVYEMISDEEYEDAMQQPITTVYHGRPIEVQASYVAEMVRQQIIDKFGEEAYDQGYQVYTTIDTNMQQNANAALTRAVIEYDQRHGYRGPVKKLFADSNYLEELKDVPTVNNLIPAAVTELHDQEAIIRLKDGRHATIGWKGMSWIKAGAEKAEDILDIGNVIYVSQLNNEWTITQIPQVEGAIVAMDPNNGAIYALVGGFDYEKSGFNRATQASRQPGSSFKPLVYAAAIENGFTAASLFNDSPIMNDDPSGDEWRPQNHTKEFNGPTRLRVALSKSMNLVSIRLLQALGVRKAVSFLKSCGINASSLDQGLTLALGTNHLSPVELAAGFSLFPNGGHKIDPYYIAKIVDYQGKVIYTADPVTVCEVESDDCISTAPQVMKPQTAYIISSMLQDAVKNGTGKRALELGRNDLAGKTGTTNDQHDGWFAGYNRDLVVTTWMGYDEPRTLKEYGGTTALPMWLYFMQPTMQGKPDHVQAQPEGLVTVRIDPATGLLARPGQENAVFEIFTEDTVPQVTATRNVASSHGTGAADSPLLEVDTIF
jgi:penicillin-binding protein 1A